MSANSEPSCSVNSSNHFFNNFASFSSLCHPSKSNFGSALTVQSSCFFQKSLLYISDRYRPYPEIPHFLWRKCTERVTFNELVTVVKDPRWVEVYSGYLYSVSISLTDVQCCSFREKKGRMGRLFELLSRRPVGGNLHGNTLKIYAFTEAYLEDSLDRVEREL